MKAIQFCEAFWRGITEGPVEKGGQNLTTSILVRPPAPRAMKRQKQVPNEYQLDIIDAIYVIYNWLERKPNFLWNEHPEDVVKELVEESELFVIPYHRAMEILHSAMTTKMRGDANAGMQHIRDAWMDLKTRVDNS